MIAASLRKAKVVPEEARVVTDQHSTALGRLKSACNQGTPKTNIPRYYAQFLNLTHNVVEEWVS